MSQKCVPSATLSCTLPHSHQFYLWMPDLVLTNSISLQEISDEVFSVNFSFSILDYKVEIFGLKMCPIRNRPTSLHQIATVGDIFQTFTVYEEDKQ